MPPSDSGRGGDDKYDIYLIDMEGQGGVAPDKRNLDDELYDSSYSRRSYCL